MARCFKHETLKAGLQDRSDIVELGSMVRSELISFRRVNRLYSSVP
jgi:hypothetical protein